MSVNGDSFTSNNDPLPQRRGVDRLLGISPDGREVDNVTEANRYAVDPKKPWIPVNLFDEDRTVVIARVFMPNTRERPDALLYEGDVYEVVTTNVDPAQYRKVMSLLAVDNPPVETGENNASTEQQPD